MSASGSGERLEITATRGAMRMPRATFAELVDRRWQVQPGLPIAPFLMPAVMRYADGSARASSHASHA